MGELEGGVDEDGFAVTEGAIEGALDVGLETINC